MTYITVNTDVDIDIGEIDTDDLVEELERRGKGMEVESNSGTELVTAIYQKRRLGQDYQRDLDQLIYQTIGRIM